MRRNKGGLHRFLLPARSREQGDGSLGEGSAGCGDGATATTLGWLAAVGGGWRCVYVVNGARSHAGGQTHDEETAAF